MHMMNFVRDYFFTDISNHVEFLKWTQTLDKEDDVLLIGILERLAAPDDPPLPVEPFYGSVDTTITTNNNINNDSKKNPLNIAKGYALMQGLDGHDYNMFEFAYLSGEDSWRTRCIAYLAALIQGSFLVVLIMYNFVDTHIRVRPHEGFFDDVVVVMFVSTALFGARLRHQFLSCEKFVSTMNKLAEPSSNDIFLYIDRLVNQVLGVSIFFFNIYFILVSDTPTDAVLDSVALLFIIEIDDQFKPNWDDDMIEDATAFLLRGYVQEPFDRNDILVVRDGPELISDEKFYIQINDDHEEDDFDYSVTVHTASSRDQNLNVAQSYIATRYCVSGPKAMELREAFESFHALQNFLDFFH